MSNISELKLMDALSGLMFRGNYFDDESGIDWGSYLDGDTLVIVAYDAETDERKTWTLKEHR